MKTIVRKDNQASIYCFADDVTVQINADSVAVGEPTLFIIADCNSFNVELYTNVSAPDDWQGWKYQFDGAEWTLNPGWQDPALS